MVVLKTFRPVPKRLLGDGIGFQLSEFFFNVSTLVYIAEMLSLKFRSF